MKRWSVHWYQPWGQNFGKVKTDMANFKVIPWPHLMQFGAKAMQINAWCMNVLLSPFQKRVYWNVCAYWAPYSNTIKSHCIDMWWCLHSSRLISFLSNYSHFCVPHCRGGQGQNISSGIFGPDRPTTLSVDWIKHKFLNAVTKTDRKVEFSEQKFKDIFT